MARQIECRLRKLNLFVTLCRQPTLTCMILETIIFKGVYRGEAGGSASTRPVKWGRTPPRTQSYHTFQI